MHGPPDTVKVYEELQRMGRTAQEVLETAEKKRDAVKHYDSQRLIELLNSLSAFCSLDLRWRKRRWDEFEKMIVEAAHFPYPLYRPIFKSNLIVIIRQG